MRIGIVTTWLERGASYVSKSYMELLEAKGHEVYIYARGGEQTGKKTIWDGNNVYWGERNKTTKIYKNRFFRWIRKNNLNLILFNEQKYFPIIASVKLQFPNVKLASYVDYYKEDTIPFFQIFDFLICNTHRHIVAMSGHSQCYYLKWGVNTDIFIPSRSRNCKQITFFHSVGMSDRKGTDLLVSAFIEGKLYEKSNLVIHTQISIEKACKFSTDELSKYGIEIINRTVTAPGLYHLGDVYVYPTKLDGLGLTLYEALSCGLPVITTDNPPMNEVITNDIGKLVKVEEYHSRKDGYFWPLSVCNKQSLIKMMKFYIDNPEILRREKIAARETAVRNYRLHDRADQLDMIVNEAVIKPINNDLIYSILEREKSEKKNNISKLFDSFKILFFIKEMMYKLKDIRRI